MSCKKKRIKNMLFRKCCQKQKLRVFPSYDVTSVTTQNHVRVSGCAKAK